MITLAHGIIDQLGNPKVDNLRNWATVALSNKNIRWLDVAMDNAALMSMLDCTANVDHQLDAVYPAAGMDVLATNPRPEGAPLLPSTTRPLTSGVYQERDKLLAINRPEQEDVSGSLDDQTIKSLFAGLDLNLISGSFEQSSLANEIWKSLAVLMVIALISEAALTMPPVQPVISNSGFAARKVAA